MPNQPVLGRRPLLAATAAAAGAAAFAASPSSAVADPRRGALAALVGDAAAAAPLVRAYLARVPDAPDRLRALAARLAAGPAARGAEELRAWLAAARRDDFAAGDVLVLEGWVLARSEAELLALAALA